ncbi:aldo/keto reductase [Echinicola shivajiensis]|uniref:aldo/keto reductase n=1 Tax=Echinicola shivajiensis TaxID=1035916 RepID=UPI001BFC9A04|nr:aldo/keto reductase [Echinicola shivajiensis]
MNIMVHKLAIGTVQFGLDYGISNKRGRTSLNEVREILSYCDEIGINTLDTASAYGDAESILGKIGIGKFKLISKFLFNNSSEEFKNQLKTTLFKLKASHLYGYLFHRPLSALENNWEWDELQASKDAGLIEKIGFSFNEPLELEKIMDKGFLPDLIQVPYSYLDRRFEKYMIALKEKEVEVHTRSCFLQGLFFMDPDFLPTFFNPLYKFLSEFKDSAYNHGSLLKFVVESPYVDKVVLGIENKRQLQENIESMLKAKVPDLLVPNLTNDILMPSRWPNTK